MRIKHFFARVQNLHRPSRLLREQRHAELEVERLGLAAECAADHWLHDADARDIEVEHARQLAMQVVRHLRGTPHRQHAGGREVADGAVRLDGRVRGALEEIFAFDDDVGVGERRVDVTKLEMHVLRDVAVAAGLVTRVDLRCIRVQRALRLENRLEQLVLDADQSQCAVRGFFVNCCNRGHAITDVAYAVDAERILITRPTG